VRNSKIFWLLFLFPLSLFASGNIIKWSGGNRIQLFYLSSPDLAFEGENYLLVKPWIEVPGFEIDFLPFLKVNVKLFRKNERIYETALLPALISEYGLVYCATIGEEYLESADKMVLVIGPDRGMVKDEIEDEGSILDSTYMVTLYQISVSDATLVWKQHSVKRISGIFYPWDFHEDILRIVNVIVQAGNDSGSTLANDITLLKKRYIFEDNDEKQLISLASNFLAEGKETSARMILKALSFYAIKEVLHGTVTSYEDVEKIWVWGKGFYSLLGKCGKSDEWDSLLYSARIEVLMGEDPLANILGSWGLLLNCAGDRYYRDVTSATYEALSEAEGLLYFFKPVAEEISFNTESWEKSLTSYSHPSTEPVFYVFSFLREAISYYMDRSEEGESYFLNFVSGLVELAGNWVFERLGGDAFSTFNNDFNIWKSAVLSENYAVARDARLDLLGIMNQLIESVGGK